MTVLEKIEEALQEFDLDSASGFYAENLSKATRAVLMAIRDPSEAIIAQIAGTELTSGHCNDLFIHDDSAAQSWRDLIDAILKGAA